MEKNELGQVMVGVTMVDGQPCFNALEFAAHLDQRRRNQKTVSRMAGYNLRSARKKGDVQGMCEAEWQSGWLAGYDGGIRSVIDLVYDLVRFVRDEAAREGQHES